MKRKVTLGAAIALAAVAPAIVAPRLTTPAHAQAATAEYPDVPRGHWAYDAINKLSQAGIIEGYSMADGGGFKGNRAMTRYEFAVAIARLLEKIQVPTPQTVVTPAAAPDLSPYALKTDIPDISNLATKTELNDAIAALRAEFADELARLGVRVDAVETRVTNLENRVAQPSRVTITPSILHRTGSATYIDNNGAFGANALGFAGARTILDGNIDNPVGGGIFGPIQPNNKVTGQDFVNGKYGYTDFELRLTDRVTDRLSVNAALRSLGSTQEDPWAGDSSGGAYLNEAYAVANLGGRSFLGAKGLNLILGRQRTKIGQGLLYDNDLAPTDQIQAQFNIGPVQISGFLGGNNNNQRFAGGGNPYLSEGAVPFLGLSGVNSLGNTVFGNGTGFTAAGGADPFFPQANNADAIKRASGASVGFPGAGLTGFGAFGADAQPYAEDNESLVRLGFNLFRISGNPVGIGITRNFDGVQNQRGDSIDLTVPLFNRTIGVEYVRQKQYFNGAKSPGNPRAYNITVPILRARALDLNFAYGKATNDFEYFVSSAANPFARTYAEALFDRPLALGAPMVSNLAGQLGQPVYASAKKVYDFSGTLRILRRLPLDFRFYRAYGSELAPGGARNALDLGDVYTIGSTFNISPGLDLEVKYGQYRLGNENPTIINAGKIKYIRVGANVGF
jgi:hypothetical protein